MTWHIAAHLAFAMAEHGGEVRRLWICATILVVAFLVRPFAMAAVIGSAGAIALSYRRGKSPGLNPGLILPFIAALAVSVLIWLWLTALRPSAVDACHAGALVYPTLPDLCSRLPYARIVGTAPVPVGWF